MVFAFVDIYAIIKFGYEGSRIESPMQNNIKSVLQMKKMMQETFLVCYER